MRGSNGVRGDGVPCRMDLKGTRVWVFILIGTLKAVRGETRDGVCCVEGVCRGVKKGMWLP